MNKPSAARLRIGPDVLSFDEPPSWNFHLNLLPMRPRLGVVGACDASHSLLV
jgi:hypothetical protein